jgi:outer membrane lipoprotein-sorting protein
MVKALCIAGVFSLVFSAAAGQEKPVLGQFAADVVRTMSGETTTDKMTVKKDRMRMEITHDGKTTVSIIRMDKGVTWMLMDNKQYMEMKSVDVKDAPVMKEKEKDMAEIKKLGEEKVSGFTCEKTLYIYKDKSLGEMTQWFSKKLMYPLKMEYRKNGKVEMTQEMKNIKEGPAPDAEFEVPAGYRKFEMPANMNDMMKGMMPGMKGMKGKTPVNEEEGSEE